ncbi:MAG: hypothetical protein ACO3QO_05440 [Candidatus Kapaibacteriota bacterium]
MNRLHVVIALFLVVGSMGLSGCRFFDDDPVGPDTAGELRGVVEGTSWVVSYLLDDGLDVTSTVSEYVLTFNTDGSLALVHNGTSEIVMGTWRAGYDDGSTKLWINLPDVDPYDELDEDWDLIAQTNDRLEFGDDVHDDRHDDDDDDDYDDDDDDDDDDRLVLVRAQP